jgi:DNA-binding response OmpR family regulator
LKKILVVDDEVDVTYTIKMMLEQEGHKVDVFNDSIAAIKAFRAHRYDLILLDIRMPKMDGFELYARIRKMDENTRVYFMTAFDVYRDQFGQLPNSDKIYFINKPFDSAQLKKIIKNT